MLRRVVRELTTAGCPASRASRCARAAVPARAFGTAAAPARASATPSSEEPEIAFDPRVDTYTERRRASGHRSSRASPGERAADFKRARGRGRRGAAERARIEEAKAARKAASFLSPRRGPRNRGRKSARARAPADSCCAAAARRRARATRLCRSSLRKTAREEALHESLAELGHRGGPGRARIAHAPWRRRGEVLIRSRAGAVRCAKVRASPTTRARLFARIRSPAVALDRLRVGVAVTSRLLVHHRADLRLRLFRRRVARGSPAPSPRSWREARHSKRRLSRASRR